MNYRPFVILSVLAFIAISSCESPTAAVIQGNVSGRVYLQPLKGKIDQENHAVSLNLTGNKSYSTISADSGKFMFTGVEQGIYSLTYSKAGFTPYTMDNIQFVGNGTLKLYNVTLDEIDTIANPPDTNNNSNNLDRRCYGYVQLFDENGDSLTDNSGVQIAINSTNITSTTEKSGLFYFQKYPSGSYDITISKNGFENLVIPQIVFPDSNTIKSKKQLQFQNYKTIELAKPPSLSIQLESVSFGNYFIIGTQQDGSHDTTFTFQSSSLVSPQGYGKRVWGFIIMGDEKDVNQANYFGTIDNRIDILSNPERTLRTSNYMSTGKYQFQTRWHIEHAGQPIYFRTYLMWARGNGSSIQYFVDPKTQRKVYSGVSSSNVMMYVFPTMYK